MVDTLPALPPRHKAIIQGPGGNPTIVQSAPFPSIEPEMILVKTVAVALNPHRLQDARQLPISRRHDRLRLRGRCRARGISSGHSPFLRSRSVIGYVEPFTDRIRLTIKRALLPSMCERPRIWCSRFRTPCLLRMPLLLGV